MRRALLPLACSLAACSGSDTTPDPGGPDPTAVFEVFERDVKVGDIGYPADVVQLFRTEDVLPSLEVRALLPVGEDVYAGTAGGLMRLTTSRDAFARVSAVDGPVVDLVSAPSGLAVVGAHTVWWLGPDDALLSSFEVPTATLTAVTPMAGVGLIFGTTDGLLATNLEGTVTSSGAFGHEIRDVVTIGSEAYAATAQGVLRWRISTGELLEPWTAPAQLADDDARALAVTQRGAALWVGTKHAVSLVRVADGSAEIRRPGLESGLPTAEVRAIVDRAGVVLIGHEIGGTGLFTDRVEHYHSLRWIPAQRVDAVAVDGRGDRWLATAQGISHLSTQDTTLAARAETNEGFLQARHWRMDGFVDDRISVADEWTLEGIRTGDHDNDGLWTQMQIGAWCYAYATTKEERFYAAARKALEVMFLQVDVPAKTFEAAGLPRGFVTRSLVRDDEGEVFTSKATQDNWHLQAYEGREYYWKDDTSSDEYAGHFFGYPIFHDLCAKDDAERAEVAGYMAAATDYIIDNDYVLIDLDGQPTLHGHWEDLAIAADGVDACVDRHGIERAQDCLSSRHGGGWLNGAEILGQLLATWHVTKDSKYLDEYERLFTEERYGELIAVTDETFTVTRPAIANHSDHELAMLAYTTLLRYEPYPERRAQYVQSLLDFYEHEREEHNPWQVAVIGAYHPGEVDTEGALKTLRDMPLDWRTWRVDNAHRQDAERWPADRHGDPQFSRVFPYDEIRTMKWNGSPYVVAGGGSGRGVLAPTPYLLAYWMLRYYRILE